MDAQTVELELAKLRIRSLRGLARRAQTGGTVALVFGCFGLLVFLPLVANLAHDDPRGFFEGGGFLLSSIVLMQALVLWVSSRLHRAAARSLDASTAQQNPGQVREGIARLAAAFRLECVGGLALVVTMVLAALVVPGLVR